MNIAEKSHYYPIHHYLVGLICGDKILLIWGRTSIFKILFSWVSSYRELNKFSCDGRSRDLPRNTYSIERDLFYANDSNKKDSCIRLTAAWYRNTPGNDWREILNITAVPV